MTRYFSIICLFAFISCAYKSEKEQTKVYSYWSIKNRQTNEYISNTANDLLTSESPIMDASMWEMVAADEFTYIKNKETGKYLVLDTLNNTLKCTATLGDLGKWQFEGFDYEDRQNCGWYLIENQSKPDAYLVLRDDELHVTGAVNTLTDLNAHWSFIREEGSTLPFEISPNGVVEASFVGERTAKYISDNELETDYLVHKKNWKLEADISQFPQFEAPNYKLLVALYNLALEESLLNIRQEDSTFMAGALWYDTWTRDAIYSIHLAYAWLMPEVSKRTLEKQTLQNPVEALQDTGSGGSWPISTDRVAWGIAAWQYYLATGDLKWIEDCYELLSYTAEKDIHVAFDSGINLFGGETCSMDWRTHTYPNWFSNANIMESFSSGTNALHAFMYYFLRESGKILKKPAEEVAKWDKYHNEVKQAINDKFWMEDKGYYSAYMYPKSLGYFVSERGGAMSNGLNIVLGIADEEKEERVAADFPLYPYGAPTLYPSIPDEYAYHNKGIWPVWETYFMLGAKKANNTQAVEHIMKSLIRASALFLTHKENMTYDTGFNENTALNSDRQLWSVASYLGMVYRVIFGMEMTPEGLVFQPVVPEMFVGPFMLNNFKYRDAVINLKVSGTGSEIESLKYDSELQELPFVLPTDAKGAHTIEIVMKDGGVDKSKINLVKAGEGYCWSPAEPKITLLDGELTWKELPGLVYKLWDGESSITVSNPYKLDMNRLATYSLYSESENGFASDLSNPITITSYSKIYEAEDAHHIGKFATNHEGYQGRGYVIDFVENPAALQFEIDIPKGKEGNYMFQLKGANGYGPHGTYCAIRSVFVDNEDVGTFVLESTGNWEKWTKSNAVFVNNLSIGSHTIKILYNPESEGWDSNMSRDNENANNCLIDYLEVIKVN